MCICKYVLHLFFLHVYLHCRIPIHRHSAFLSGSNDLQSYLHQIEERGDAGTPPGRNNPVCATPLNVVLPDQLSKRRDHDVVMQPPPKRELVGGDECWTVYKMEALLTHSVVYMESGFLSRDILTLYGVSDMTALYCSKVLYNS